MPGFDGIGRLLIIAGAVLILFGLVFSLLQHLQIGRLPGDFVWKRGQVTVYLPLATSILLSLILTLLLNLWVRR